LKQEQTMPEGPEVELDKPHETIKEELEKEGGSFLKRISLTTTILAVLAALASLQAGATVNEALALKTEAVQLQSEASDQWAYYQAKGIKAAVQEASRASWIALGRQPPAEYAENARRYGEEQAGISRKAKEKEQARDKKQQEAARLLHKHHVFADAVALFQVSIALGAVAALTRSRVGWFGSLIAGGIGIIFFVWPFFD
jgi:hypothetical protein